MKKKESQVPESLTLKQLTVYLQVDKHTNYRGIKKFLL